MTSPTEHSGQPLPAPPPRRRGRTNNAFQNLMLLHWVMAATYLVLFTTGTFMAQLEREVALRGPLFDFHKSLGVLSLWLLLSRILILLRVWWRKYTRRLPRLSPAWWRKTLLHGLLYVFMWAVPVTGLFFSNSRRPNNVEFFGIPVPDVFPVNPAAVEFGRGLHFWFAYTFLAAVVLHAIDQRKVWQALARRWAAWRRSSPLGNSGDP